MLNDQRKVVFEQRKEIMSADDVSDQIPAMGVVVIDELVERHIPPKAYAEQWDAKGLSEEVTKVFGIELPIVDWTKEEGIADEEVRDRIMKTAETRAAERAANFGPDVMRYARRRSCCSSSTMVARAHRQPRSPSPVCRPAAAWGGAIR